MCRILFIQGTNTKKASKYLDAFRGSGTCDKRFEKLVEEIGISGLEDQHIHGWGYLLVTEKNTTTYLSSEFIRDDDKGFKKLKNDLQMIIGEFVLLAEIRVTDKGFVSSFNAHPFFFCSKNGYEGYLFHNGFLDGQKMATSLGIDAKHYTTKNSSSFIGLHLIKKLEAGKSVFEALQIPDESIQTTYNIMLFLHDNEGKYKVYIYPHIKRSAFSNNYICDCNTLYRKEEEDFLYIGSSTIMDYINEDFEKVENNKLLDFPIDFIEEYYFDGYKSF